MEILYLIVPDNTFEYSFPVFSEASSPYPCQHLSIRYDFEAEKFLPIVVFGDKKVQVIRESDHRKITQPIPPPSGV